jgi:hypothetical protein
VREEPNTQILSDIDDETATLVDAMESHRNSAVPAPLQPSKEDATNPASLALARLVYRELVNDSPNNSLAFLISQDADFVRTVARAARDSGEDNLTIIFRHKQILSIQSHWMELISTRVKRYTYLTSKLI